MKTVEAVYAASFALLQTLASSVSPPGPFKTVSRRLRLVEDVGVEEMPAVYQYQLHAVPVQQTFAGLAVMTYRAHWYIYASAPNMDAASSPILNPLVDAVLARVPQETTGTAVQVQVGGDTVSLTIDGSIEFFEGLLDNKAVARIPILIRV